MGMDQPELDRTGSEAGRIRLFSGKHPPGDRTGLPIRKSVGESGELPGLRWAGRGCVSPLSGVWFSIEDELPGVW